MDKRGGTEKTLLYIFYILIALLIIYTTYRYTDNYLNGLEFKKEFIAKDLGLSIDTLSFSSTNIKMKYNLLEKFKIENKDLKLKIKLKDIEIPKEYLLISKIEDFSIESNEINIEKNNNKIRWN